MEKIHWTRKIIHIDMDAFFAAVEERDHPEYRGKPLVVGGNPFGRGVVSTASYAARKFGIRSAMPAAQARRLCPQAIFVRPNFEKYSEASRIVMDILRQHTEAVEPMSLDEAYLDVTRHRFGIEDPVMIATLIKQNIQAVTHLTASAGVAPNLFLAKIASDFKKPDGLTVVHPEKIYDFLENLPVRKIPGVGPVTEKELHSFNLKTCSDLLGAGLPFLIKHFGKTGVFLYERANGEDNRQVEPNTPSKQYSCEETFSEDTLDKSFLKAKLKNYAQELFIGLKNEGRMGRTVVLKVKYFDFEQITRSHTLRLTPSVWQDVYERASELLEKKTLAGKKRIRLLGLGISGLQELTVNKEPDLFDTPSFSSPLKGEE